MKRTTMYLEAEVLAYLKLQNIAISPTVRRKLLAVAVGLGYDEGIDEQIQELKDKIEILEGIKADKAFSMVKLKEFYANFGSYLSTGPKTIDGIRGWLNSPLNSVNRKFIGEKADLSNERVKRLMNEALRVRE